MLGVAFRKKKKKVYLSALFIFTVAKNYCQIVFLWLVLQLLRTLMILSVSRFFLSAIYIYMYIYYSFLWLERISLTINSLWDIWRVVGFLLKAQSLGLITSVFITSTVKQQLSTTHPPFYYFSSHLQLTHPLPPIYDCSPPPESLTFYYCSPQLYHLPYYYYLKSILNLFF